MKALLLLMLAATAVFGADEWSKVKELKSGTELRVFKKGSRQPILATMDEATDERLSVATKTEQISIAKQDIDRIDYRPPKKGSRVVKETKTTEEVPQPSRPGVPNGTPGPSKSTSSNVSVEGKPDFETIYRRTAMLPAPAASSEPEKK